MAYSRLRVLLMITCVGAFGCNDDDDDDDGTTSPSSSSGSGSSGSAWLVGEDGEMLRMADDGSTSSYPLAERDDLNAIACVGSTGAWVVGGAGTVLSSDDAGASWQRHELGIDSDLHALAIAEDHDGRVTRVVVAGDGVLMSRGDAGTFASLTDDARDFTSVALDHEGERLLAVADDGSIWRAEGGATAEQVGGSSDQSLYAVSLDAAGLAAVVVGAEGYVALSHDGGTTWQPQLVPTVRDLYAVRMSFQGDALIAVGDAGTVLRIDESGTTARELLDPSLSLRGVHLHSTGAGHAVGDAGTVMFTPDIGETWTPLDVDTDAVLRGVDDFHAGAHW